MPLRAFSASHCEANSGSLSASLTAIVCTGINDFPNASRSDVEAALPMLRKAGAPLLAHAELVSAVEFSVSSLFAR